MKKVHLFKTVLDIHYKYFKLLVKNMNTYKLFSDILYSFLYLHIYLPSHSLLQPPFLFMFHSKSLIPCYFHLYFFPSLSWPMKQLPFAFPVSSFIPGYLFTPEDLEQLCNVYLSGSGLYHSIRSSLVPVICLQIS